MSHAIIFTATVIWAIYERNSGQGIFDQVLLASIVLVHYLKNS